MVPLKQTSYLKTITDSWEVAKNKNKHIATKSLISFPQ
jgi:hypothetical protein